MMDDEVNFSPKLALQSRSPWPYFSSEKVFTYDSLSHIYLSFINISGIKEKIRIKEEKEEEKEKGKIKEDKKK